MDDLVLLLQSCGIKLFSDSPSIKDNNALLFILESSNKGSISRVKKIVDKYDKLDTIKMVEVAVEIAGKQCSHALIINMDDINIVYNFFEIMIVIVH